MDYSLFTDGSLTASKLWPILVVPFRVPYRALSSTLKIDPPSKPVQYNMRVQKIDRPDRFERSTV